MFFVMENRFRFSSLIGWNHPVLACSDSKETVFIVLSLFQCFDLIDNFCSQFLMKAGSYLVPRHIRCFRENQGRKRLGVAV